MAEGVLAAVLERGAAIDHEDGVDDSDVDGRWVADWVPPFVVPIPGLESDPPAAPEAAANDAGPFDWPSLRSGSAWVVESAGEEEQLDLIRVATINCEKKMGDPQHQLALAAWAADRHLDVVAITEPGLVADPWYLTTVQRDGDQPWQVFGRHLVDRHGTRFDPATAVLLVHRSLHAHIVDSPLLDPAGRAVGVIICGGTASRPMHTLIACAYLPVGIDFGAADDAEVDRVHALLQQWCQLPGVQTAILLGDFNETRAPQDRRSGVVPLAATANIIAAGAARRPPDASRRHPVSRVAALCGDAHAAAADAQQQQPFIDSYRALFPDGGFTSAHPLPGGGARSESRIDYCLFRDSRSLVMLRASGRDESAQIRVVAATVEDHPLAKWPSCRHAPLLVALTGDFAMADEDRGIAVDPLVDDAKHEDADTFVSDPATSARVADHQAAPCAAVAEWPVGPDIQRATPEERNRAARAMAISLSAGGGGHVPSLAARLVRLRAGTSSHAELDEVTRALITAAHAATRRLPRVGSAARHLPVGGHWHAAASRVFRRLTAVRTLINAGLSRRDSADFAICAKFSGQLVGIADSWRQLRDRLAWPSGPRMLAIPMLHPAPDTALLVRSWAMAARNRLCRAMREAERVRAIRAVNSFRRRRAVAAAAGVPLDGIAPPELQPKCIADLQRVVSGARPAPVSAVTIVGPDEQPRALTSPPAVAAAFADSYASVFALRSARQPRPPAADAVVDRIDPSWWDGLMDAVSEDELIAAVSDVSWQSGAGHDGLSGGVWRALISGSAAVRTAITDWCTGLIAHRYMPAHGKHSIFSPLQRTSTGGRRDAALRISDTRPIALQPTLTKLLAKILARRFSTRLARHPILTGQYGFIRGGSAHACTTALMDACERAIAERGSAFFLFIDFKAAFDAVRHDAIGPALRRLRVPESYVEWANSSLTGMTGAVRTAGAVSAPFPVLRGTPQGGPQSPHWYICPLDSGCAAVHAAIPRPLRLHRLPATASSPAVPAAAGASSGDAMAADRLPISVVAFADDAAVVANDCKGIDEGLATWVRWGIPQDATVSGTKTLAAGIAFDTEHDTMVDARQMHTDGRLMNHGLTLRVDGVPIQWQAADAVAHLGSTFSLLSGGQAEAAVSSVTRSLNFMCRNLQARRLHVATTVYAINALVLPRVDHRLRLMQPRAAAVAAWDSLITRTVLNRAGVYRWLVKREAVVAITGVRLPSQSLLATRVADGFARLNGRDDAADTISARVEFSLAVSDPVAYRSLYPFARMRAFLDAVAHLGWRAHRVEDLTDRSVPLANAVDIATAASLAECRAAAEAASGRKFAGGRGGVDSLRCVAYTDGSASSDPADAACAWAVLFGGEWLASYSGFGSVLASLPEAALPAARSRGLFAGAPLFGGRIDPQFAHGSYAAELRAILEAVWRAPRGCHLTIRTDARSAVDAIAAWRTAEPLGRERAKMKCRPLLAAISDAIDEHTLRWQYANAADGKRGGGGGEDGKAAALPAPEAACAVVLQWIRGHESGIDEDAVANRVADCEAKWQRTSSDQQQQLHLGTAERWLSLTEQLAAPPAAAAVDGRQRAERRRYPRRDRKPSARAAAAAAMFDGSSEGEDKKEDKEDAKDSNDNDNGVHHAPGPVLRHALIDDIRRAARRQLRRMAAAEWRSATADSSQRRYAACADGAAEQWRCLAGDGAPPLERSAAPPVVRRCDSLSAALLLRTVSDSLERHLPLRGKDGLQPARAIDRVVLPVWTCTHPACSEREAKRQGIRPQQARVLFTTAHLFECTAPLMAQQRCDAAARLQRLTDRYRHDHAPSGYVDDDRAEAEAAAVQAAMSDDGWYLRWWHVHAVAQPRSRPGGGTEFDRMRANLDEFDRSSPGAADDGTPADAEAVGAAIGAFTTNRARAAMQSAEWPVAKEWRGAAVADLRWLAMRTVRSLWFASAATRMAVLDGRSADTADYNPRSAGRDAPLTAREHLDDTGGGSEDDDDEANELAAFEALQGYDSSRGGVRAAALTALASVAGVALTVCTALLMIHLPVAAAVAATAALGEVHGHQSDGGEVAERSGGERQSAWPRNGSEHCSTAHGS